MGWVRIHSSPSVVLFLGIVTKAIYFVIWEIHSLFKLFLQKCNQWGGGEISPLPVCPLITS